MTTSIQEDIDALKEFLAVRSDAELADALGVAANTISMWKARRVLPERIRTQLDVFRMMSGEIASGDRAETPTAFKALTQLNDLERQALKVALVRFVSEHPGFGVNTNLTMRTAASGPENLAAYADRAYRDLVELRRAEHLPFSDGAAILILQHLGKLHDASDVGEES